MNLDYYNQLAERLYQVGKIKELGETLEIKCYQYADMLRDDIFNMEQKQQVSVMAEDLLSKIEDVSNQNYDGGKGSSKMSICLFSFFLL